MNKPEWMPDEYEIDGFVDGCEQRDRNYVLLRYGKQQQKKLLEYLAKYAHHAKLMTVEIVMKTKLEAMLKELEK